MSLMNIFSSLATKTMRAIIFPSISLGIGWAASHLMETPSCGALCHSFRIPMELWQKPERGDYSHFIRGRAGLHSLPMLFCICVALLFSNMCSLACQMLQIQGKCRTTFSLCRTYSWPAWALLFGLTLNTRFSSNSSTMMTQHEVKNILLPAWPMLEI